MSCNPRDNGPERKNCRDRDRGGQFCLRKGLFHENIDLILSAELSSLSGEPGNFTVKIHQKPTWVDPDRCVGCGLCETVCPETVPDCFNEGLSMHKAIYLPGSVRGHDDRLCHGGNRCGSHENRG